jgi:cytochrome bd-type quinol oxidase subunit 1
LATPSGTIVGVMLALLWPGFMENVARRRMNPPIWSIGARRSA